MSVSASRVLARKLREIDANLASEFWEIAHTWSERLRSGKVTGPDVVGLQAEAVLMIEEMALAGEVGLARFTHENRIAMERSLKTMLTETGELARFEWIAGLLSSRTGAAVIAWRQGLPPLEARIVTAISDQYQAARQLDDDPEAGLALRLFSLTPVKRRRRTGVGVFPATAGQVFAWWLRVGYAMVNAERQVLTATLRDEFRGLA